MQKKVFLYLTRTTPTGTQLLVFRSHDEPGYEVPKGSVEPGESLRAAVFRELHEESGIVACGALRCLGSTCWQTEEQHFFHLHTTKEIPRRFQHRVRSDDEDDGFLYEFHWLPIDRRLETCLVQGCNRFASALAFNR